MTGFDSLIEVLGTARVMTYINPSSGNTEYAMAA